MPKLEFKAINFRVIGDHRSIAVHMNPKPRVTTHFTAKYGEFKIFLIKVTVSLRDERVKRGRKSTTNGRCLDGEIIIPYKPLFWEGC